MAAVLSNDGSTHKSRHHAHSSRIPIHSTRKKRISSAGGMSPKKTPSITISSTVPMTPVSSITISSSSPDYSTCNESWPSSEQATPPAPIRSLFPDEKLSGSKEEIDTTLSFSLSASLQHSPPAHLYPQRHMHQQHHSVVETLTERTQQLIDSSTALIQSPAPNAPFHRKKPSTPPPRVEEEGDILQQWRLRRRLEEARRQATSPSVSHLDKRVPHCSVLESDNIHFATHRDCRPPWCVNQQNTPETSAVKSHSHHHKSHISHNHHHKSHTSHNHHHESHTSHNHNAPSACNVELCRHISKQTSKKNKKRSSHKKERPSEKRQNGELQEQPSQQKERPMNKEPKRPLKSGSWKVEEVACVRYPLSLSASDDDTSWDTDTLITDNSFPPPHSSSLAEDVSLTQLLAETVERHLCGTPPSVSPGDPSHIYPCTTPCPEVDNHLKDELLADLLKRALSLSKTISEVDQCLAAMDTA